MAVDPSISLAAGQGGGGAGATAGNPLSMLATFAAVQNQLNQNRLFQQTFAARQTAGQILSTAPDMDTGLAMLERNPLTAPFAPEIGNSIRQYESTTADLQGKYQDQSLNGLHAAMKAMVTGLSNPEMLPSAISSTMATLSPTARKNVQPAVEDLVGSLTDGLPAGAAGMSTYKQRLYGLLMSAGVTPEALTGIVGQPTTRDLGGRIVSGVQAPALAGGGFVGSNTLSKSLAPQVVQGKGPAGQPVTMVAGGGAGAPVPSPSGNPMADELHGVPPPAGSLAAIENQLSASGPGAGTGPGPGSLLLQGPTATQEAAMAAAGKGAGDIQADMISAGRELPGALKRVDMMNDALSEFQAGGGASARASIGKVMQALQHAGVSGITDADINKVANSSLSGTQLFNAEVKPLVIGELKQAAQGTGRVMRSEVDAFINMMNATTDPKALMQLLNQARYQLQVGYDQTQKWPEFKAGVESGKLPGYGLEDFYSYYNSQLAPKALPATTGGGMPLGPRTDVKGAGAKPTLRYVHGKGIVPISGGTP